MKSLILLTVILIAVFGAGTVDVLFPDVIPLRPYTGIFQTSHLTTIDQSLKTNLPLVPLILIAITLLLTVTAITIFPHLAPSLSFLPLGSRGSHSRANRRASGAGWKDTSQNQMLTAEEQFRVLMQIFGKPRMVIVYGKEEKKNASSK